MSAPSWMHLISMLPTFSVLSAVIPKAVPEPASVMGLMAIAGAIYLKKRQA